MKSYSQHSEDTYLWNYIQRAKQKPTPFFIELGACDGENLSNCRLFAEQGWAGKCVDANPNYYKKLFELYKNNDKVETYHNAIISNQLKGGIVPFSIYPDFVDHSGIHKFPKYENCITMDVETIYYHDLATQPIGLLSIDLEGLDTEILIDMFTWNKNLPEYVIIEGNTPEERRDQIDLLNTQYDLLNKLDVNTLWQKREQ